MGRTTCIYLWATCCKYLQKYNHAKEHGQNANGLVVYMAEELILPRTLSINCILTSSRPWCPGSKKCLYERSSLFLPSKESLECALKRALYIYIYIYTCEQFHGFHALRTVGKCTSHHLFRYSGFLSRAIMAFVAMYISPLLQMKGTFHSIKLSGLNFRQLPIANGTAFSKIS